MTVMNTSEGRASAYMALVVPLLAAALLAILLPGCGEAADTNGARSTVVLEESGAIEPGDAQDPDHADLPYDMYTFEAKSRDAVVMEVVADGIIPLLKLMEVATGAVLAELEEKYSDEGALTYTIAGPGIYEARVYALEGGSGTYSLVVRVNP